MTTTRIITVIGLLLAHAACVAPGGETGDSDRSDDTGRVNDVNESFEIGSCTIRNRSGHGVNPNLLTDPIAELILGADGDCRTSMTEVLARLEEVDSDGCGGARTALVNEYAQLIGTGGSDESREARRQFRAVTLRPCSGREPHELAFSTGGRPITRVADVLQDLDNYDNNLPIDVQIVAFDPESNSQTVDGVFNYYNILDGQWNFFGNSRDFSLRGAGPESDDGLPRVRDCALCHTSGDLLMKELDSPWLHWEGQQTGGTPGAEKLFENRPQLGERISGKALEDVVGGEKVAGVRRGGFNNHWNPLRVEQMRNYDCSVECEGQDADCEDECNANAVYALLEPLFCSVQVNLANSPNSFPEHMIVHPEWAPPGEDSAFGGFPRPAIDAGEVGSYLDDNNSRISTRIAGRFTATVGNSDSVEDTNGVELRDTAFPMVHPVVAEIDVNYIRELERQGVISEDFKMDVLFVDYSRPLLSSQRCGLLDKYVPALPPGQRTKIIIKRELIANMGPAEDLSGFEREFRESLDDSSDADNHRADVQKFLQACTVRAGLDLETFAVDEAKSRAFTREVMAFISAVRALGRSEMLILRQFPGSMPTDDAEDQLQDNLSRIHFSTAESSMCKLNGLPSGFEP